MNAIQTTCPHILRYLVTAVISSKKRRTYIKDMVRVLQQDPIVHQDPIIEFLVCLFVHFDFDGAQQKLRECETVCCYCSKPQRYCHTVCSDRFVRCVLGLGE
jgi:translation initiation factor 3 subunit E